MQLSIVMMVKNESKYLERCLKALENLRKEVKSELIIVDTGSEDNTVDIAKKYADRVYFHEWNNDFAFMRNKTIHYAEGEWVFILDADEIIEDASELIHFFRTNKYKKYRSAIIRIKNYTREEMKYSLLSIPRLFRKDKDFRYTGAIHEQPSVKLPVFCLDTTLLHYGYMATDRELVERKFVRNVSILNKELEKDPENMYYWFQLAQSYGAHKDYEEALEADLKAFEIAKKKKINLKSCMYIYNHLAHLYHWLGRHNELEQICLEGLSVRDGYVDLYYLLGEAQRKQKKYKEAIQAYEKYLEIVFHYKDYPSYNDITITVSTLDIYELVYAELCVLYGEIGDYEKVLEYSEKIQSTDILRNIFKPIAEAYLKLNKLEGLRDYYCRQFIQDDHELFNNFTIALEKTKSSLTRTEREEIEDIFAFGDNPYAYINEIRLQVKNGIKIIGKEYLQKIQTLDFNRLPIFYSEIIYYLIVNKHQLKEIVASIKEAVLENQFQYMLNNYKDEFLTAALQYINTFPSSEDLYEIRIGKILKKAIVLSNILKENEMKNFVETYLRDGIYYVNQIYHSNIIENEMIEFTRSDEDAFMIYMDHGRKVKNIDRIKYIQYLKKALSNYPTMKKVIEFLLKEIQEEHMPNQNNELVQYQIQVKKTIKAFINKGELEEAKLIISEYEEIVKEDIDIYCMKSVVFIMEGKLNEAKKVLEQGLKIDDKNYDLLYNFKYILEMEGKKEKAHSIQVQIASLMQTLRYVDPNIGIEEFFQFLKSEGIRYVVLRWFEKLPYIGPGEDLDILVHDEDLIKISKYFIPSYVEGAIPCDVYSMSAIRGSSYAGLAYYPHYLAEQILNNRVLWNENVYVPCAEDYLLSIMYHITYHKAERSGIPVYSNSGEVLSKSVNKYFNILQNLSVQNNIEIEYNLEWMHNYLKFRNWNPSMDLIRKLGMINGSKWLSQMYKPMGFNQLKNGELMIFFIREWVYKRNLSDFIINWLDENGFDIILTHKLDIEEQERATKYIRGGNWEEGILYATGGKPYVMVVAYDHHPIPVPHDKKQAYPFVANGHFFKKEFVRQEVNKLFEQTNLTNPIHTSDDEIEAWEYVEIVCPQQIEKIKEKITEHVEAYKTKEKVIKIFNSFNHRSKTELIEYKDGIAVKKTFRKGKERFMIREKFAGEMLSQKSSMIPPLLESGENYIIIPYYQDILKEDPLETKKIFYSHAKTIGKFLKLLYDEGYAHLDFHPGNFIYSKEEGLKMIDFEYLYKYEKKPSSFMLSYDIVGRPKNFKDDRPNYFGKGLIAWYDELWVEKAGLHLKDIAQLAFDDHN